MRIESGPTSERRTRTIMWLVLCTVFAAWFAYDGFYKYPQENLNWAVANLPFPPDSPRTNPQVVKKNIEPLLPQIQAGKLKAEELREHLGEPALKQDEQFVYLGRDIQVMLEVANGKVTRLRSESLAVHSESGNPRITVEGVQGIQVGAASSDVLRDWGNPSSRQTPAWWYIGPAIYIQFDVVDGIVRFPAGVGGAGADFEQKPPWHENAERGESHLAGQKGLAVILAVLSVGTVVLLGRVLRFRVVLDDSGLTLAGRFISWDSMSGWDLSRWNRGQITLQYTSAAGPASVVLDSWQIDRFREIVIAIAQTKGFELPMRSGEAENSSSAGE